MASQCFSDLALNLNSRLETCIGRKISYLKAFFSESNFQFFQYFYAPNIPAHRKNFVANLHSFFFSGSQLWIGGDFNYILSDLDKRARGGIVV